MVTLGELRKLGYDPEGRNIKFISGFHSPKEQLLLQEFLALKRHNTQLDGWTCLSDAGCYSLVMTHPTFQGQVAKVSANCNDPAFWHYMEAITLQNQHNPHVPQVSGYVRVKDGSFLVLMEKLNELAQKDHSRIKPLQDMTEGKYPLNSYVRKRISDEEAERYAASLPAQLFELCMLIRANPNHWGFDISHMNVLKRGDDLVLTDVYAIDYR